MWHVPCLSWSLSGCVYFLATPQCVGDTTVPFPGASSTGGENKADFRLQGRARHECARGFDGREGQRHHVLVSRFPTGKSQRCTYLPSVLRSVVGVVLTNADENVPRFLVNGLPFFVGRVRTAQGRAAWCAMGAAEQCWAAYGHLLERWLARVCCRRNHFRQVHCLCGERAPVRVYMH